MSELQFDTNPSPEVLRQLHQNLSTFNQRHLPEDSQPFGFAVRDGAGRLIAGAEGKSFWGWLYLDLLWVAEAQRGRGMGGQLLARIEALATQRGCTGVYLWTMSFQAPGFYERMGYRQTGEIGPFTGGHFKRYYQKVLAPAGPLEAPPVRGSAQG
ncbi:MAG: GNAT family N-acetyltransferase [Planctomycetota bacterium]